MCGYRLTCHKIWWKACVYYAGVKGQDIVMIINWVEKHDAGNNIVNKHSRLLPFHDNRPFDNYLTPPANPPQCHLGARLTKAYDVTIQVYRNSHAKKTRHWHAYFVVNWLKSVCEILKVLFEISHKILNPYTTKSVFYEVLKTSHIMIS